MIVGATWSYVGDRKGLFQAGPLRQDYDSYSQVDLRTQLELNSWRASLFATNVADKRGVLGGGIGNIDPNSFFIIQPRTYGLSLSKAF